MKKLSTIRFGFGGTAILVSTLALVYFGALRPEILADWLPLAWTGNVFVDGKLNYQIVTFGIGLASLGIVFAISPANAKRFFRPGKLNAPAQPIQWLDIKPGTPWTKVGTNFSVIVSLATGAFVYFNVAQGQSLDAIHTQLLPMILILAAMNAFTEEAITRLSVVTLLDGSLPRPIIYIISALLFGIPHFFGVPGGVIGSLMAGFLGWLLAKSIAETEGVFWAWVIHFLQDVIIFGGLFLAAL